MSSRTLLIAVLVDRFPWAFVHGTDFVCRGVAFTFEELRSIELRLGADTTKIPDGFRILDVRLAAARYNWALIEPGTPPHTELLRAVYTLTRPESRSPFAMAAPAEPVASFCPSTEKTA